MTVNLGVYGIDTCSILKGIVFGSFRHVSQLYFFFVAVNSSFSFAFNFQADIVGNYKKKYMQIM